MEKNCGFKFYVSIEKKRGKKSCKIETAIKDVCQAVPSKATIYRWFNEDDNIMKVREETRGRPSVLQSTTNIDEVKRIIDINPSASRKAIAEEIDNAKDTGRAILKEDLHMWKVCST